jgi:hypothetical protein
VRLLMPFDYPFITALLIDTYSSIFLSPQFCRTHRVFTGASCPDGASFLPTIAGSEWQVSNGAYSLAGCPPGYELAAQECSLCPASSYCPGGSAAHIPCSEELFSSPGSNSSSDCRHVVFVFMTISFPMFVEDFSASEHRKVMQGLALVSDIYQGDILEVGLSEAGFGRTLIMYKFATSDAIAAENLRLRLSKELSNSSSFKFKGLADGYLETVTVSACPPGFYLQLEVGTSKNGKDGLCELCPAGFFCIGGSLVSTPCPLASYSLPGANSSSSCTSAVFVIVSARIQTPQRNFEKLQQQKYIVALALASGTAAERVSILSVSSADNYRRLGSDETRVRSQIAAKDTSSAASISNRLDGSTLNFELSAQGLPAASLDSITVLASSPQLESANTPPWVIALAVVCGVVVLLLLVLVYLRIFHSKVNVAEDSALTLKIIDVRQRLALLPSDGFFLNSERLPFWSKKRSAVFLRQSHLESAGRLALFRDFDIMSFDAFCLSLYVEQGAESKARYQALCHWILELSETLINPIPIPQDERCCHMGCSTVDARFRFFVHKVGKIRIWIDDNELFTCLKVKAQLFMDQIASECDLRYHKLCSEPRGQELVSLQHIMQQDTSKWIAGKGHALLRRFSSGPFSNIPASVTAGPLYAASDSVDFEFEEKRKSSSALDSSATVSRQDHMQAC